ncbi:pyridoxal phosphate synthase yaaE subunit [Rhodoglobus vestalii]|uniref:Pyridoxal 5'-phosphate synthase subunit PdxT n=1 Tax=Rhodoglobus vestalii TaxID=193384 RepID=A0A8H2K1V4_9MICO|nr:pyridoxal 5'-phosphate synthase glutaminase subunit PdxT [Rhodoglobus vestalii]TQO18555.1 pyridoxal phosphate synthase yaaE subunit [Rhodoglobus vestalii]
MAGSSSAVGPRPIGVLALQGDFREHLQVLQQLGETAIAVKTPGQLEHIAGLILPGGESSVIDKLSRLYGLAEPIKAAIAHGLPVYGTCAGLILLADTVLDAIPGQQSFGGLDIVVRRNAFGSQSESFETALSVPELGTTPVEAVFIRAPVVESIGPRARALATLDDGRIVAVEHGALMGTSFHPEITGDTRFHEYFVARVRASK